MNPFDLGVTKTETTEQKQAATRRKIDAVIGTSARHLHYTYGELMKQVYQNPLDLTPQQVAATLTQEESVQLRTLAILVKSLINRVSPGKIDDFLPTATITMPANLFPEV